jgi:hypothetical protein
MPFQSLCRHHLVVNAHLVKVVVTLIIIFVFLHHVDREFKLIESKTSRFTIVFKIKKL